MPRIGVAHVAGKYTVPSGSGTQFADGSSAILTAGYPTLKIYCTGSYLTDYPLQSSWSSVPTTCKQLAQTTQFATELAKDWHTVIMTTFSFANGPFNWWRSDIDVAKLNAEYTELYDLACYLLSTYNGTGRRFVFQNWEGDWAFMDAFTPDTYVDRKMVDRYVAFHGARKRAILQARRDTPSDCSVLFAFECNRVVDMRLYPHRRRILRDIAPRIQPDVISYSAYDGTIVDQGSWGANYAAWNAATTPVFRKALRSIALAFPGVPIQIGEFGYPEGPEKPFGRDIGAMVTRTYEIASEVGALVDFIYWEVFDNEEYSPGVPRGFYVVKPDGTTSAAGTALEALL